LFLVPSACRVPERPSQTVIIVTALDVETRAVLRQLGDYEEEVVQGTVFFVGTFEDWRVAVVEVGPGNVAVAAIADRAISHFKADVAIFVGVGGGVKDVALGDVVVASKVYGYEGGKDKANAFLPRSDLHHSAHALEQRARAMAKRKNWHARLDKALGLDSPNLLVAPIAAGEKVVASTRSPTARFLKKQYSDAVAVEMEGRGFLEAVHINSVLGTVIRGISDQLNGKSVSDKAGWQRKAADAACAAAFEMLATLTPAAKVGSDGSTSPPGTPSDAPPKPATVALPAATPSPARHGDGPTFVEMPTTLNEGSFFREGEVLARVGVPEDDEVQFSFRELPDSYVRIIPKHALKKPITTAHLNHVADLAPLLKHRQFGGFKFVNRHGAIAYDPGGPHRGGPAPLSWATQLFSNGELWLVSNKMIVRERGERPQWVPVPFIPAPLFEIVFYDKVRVAVAFAAQHLGLTFPCVIEMGLLGTANVTLAINQEDLWVIRKEKIVWRQDLADAAATNINAALLSFFNAVYDATGYARPEGLFGFPPNPPKA
jgi:nucleoside phosphorylase